MNFVEAFQVIRKYQKEPPVNITNIIKRFGINLKGVRYFNRNLSGSIAYDSDSNKYTIYVNLEDSLERKRFTAAHELGHYVLHKDIIKNGITEETLYRSSIEDTDEEREADSFAAEILMPFSLLRKKEYQDKEIEELAEIFNVSYIAIANRLGYIS